nr:hypothetical protein RTCK_01502 [Rhizobium sp. TCK]
MQTPLNANASPAGALLSSSVFEIPQFQREYSWQDDEVGEFWRDLQGNLDSDTYFLGLIILTDEHTRKLVVDGQQRLITLSLLATALYFEASKRGREALADRIQADFLRSINYVTDQTDPRINLSDPADNATFQAILDTGQAPAVADDGSVSARICQSFRYLQGKLSEDLASDPFKRLGKWTEFLTHRVYFAVFIHPEPSAAYQVYEVINTRGKELTTADLLKNYILSQTPQAKREDRYIQWRHLASPFAPDGNNTFVQYIRHVVTVRCGHILPKDLFSFLAQRVKHAGRIPPTSDELIALLERSLPLYMQMVDPTLEGPAEPQALKIYAALNSLGVIAVRPILLALADVPNSLDGMDYILRLVVRRIVVGNLGTGNVERRLSEAAKRVHDTQDWHTLEHDLRDLNPTKAEFIEQLRKRSLNKGVLTFIRRSIIERTTTPEATGVLHFVWTRQAANWEGMGADDGPYWYSTLGNSILVDLDRRPKAALDWAGVKKNLIPHAIAGEWVNELNQMPEWSSEGVEQLGLELARAAGDVWY